MNKSIKGITIQLGADTTKLGNALKDVTSKSVKLSQELKQVEKGLKFNPGNAELIAQKQKILSQQVAVTSEKLNALKAAQAQVNQKFAEGKVSPEQYRAFNREIVMTQGQLNSLKGKLGSITAEQKKTAEANKQLQTFFRATGTSIDHFSNVLGSKLTNAIKNGTASSKQLNEAIDKIGKHSFGASTDVEKLKNTLSSVDRGNSIKNVSKELEKLSKDAEKANKSVKDLGEKMGNVGKSLSTHVTLPVAAAGTAATAVFTSFDDGMRKVQATMGNKLGNTTKEVEKNMKSLTDEAKRLGSTTAFSASDAAAGMEKLALAGWDTNQIMAATEPMLNLASAAAMDLGSAADIVSDTMSAFGMDASEAEKATDIFAKTMSSTNTDVLMLGEAMKYSGAAAKASNMDLAQTNALLGTFANAGIKGSSAGTTLSSMLRDVKKNAKDGAVALGDTKVAVYDANGNMRDMTSILVDVEKATKGMTGAQRDAALSAIFGDEAIRGVNIALEQGTDSVKKLEGELRNSQGTSKDMKETMEGGLGGAFRSLKSALEGLAISFGETLAPIIKSVAEKLTEMASGFSKLSPSAKSAIVVIGLIVAAIGPLLIIIGSLLGALATIGTVLGVSAAVVGGVILAIIAAVAAIVAIYVYWDDIKKYFIETWESIKTASIEIWESIKDYFSELWEGIKNTASEIWDGISNYFSEIWNSISQTATEIWEGIITYLTELWTSVTETANEIWTGIATFLTESWNSVKETATEIWTGITEFIINLWNGVVEFLTPILQGIADFFTTIWEGISTVVQTVWGFISQYLQAIWTAILYFATPIFESIKNFISECWNTISSTTSLVWETIKNFLVSCWNGLVAFVMPIFEQIKSWIIAVWDTISSATMTVWDTIKNFLQQCWNGLVAFVTPIFNSIKDWIVNTWNAINSTTSAVWNAIKSYLASLWNSIVSSATTIFNAIKNAISTVWNMISSTSSSIWNGIKSTLSSIWEGIKSTASSVWNGLKDAIMTPVRWVTSAVTGAFEGMKSSVLGVWNGIKSGISVAINGIIRMINKFIDGFNTPAELLNNIPGVSAPTIPHVPMLATGGHVLGDGQFIAGEAGPELFTKKGNSVSVTPLSSRERSLGITGSINQLVGEMRSAMANSIGSFSDVRSAVNGVYSNIANGMQTSRNIIMAQQGDILIEVPVNLDADTLGKGSFRYVRKHQKREEDRNSAF
ncbi:phage tail tape measure protein [Bacillus pacificus]|uniref:phage tail tape measure protein n=1 Tax=Bacillus pacificus TaxID=2026187 RepID=UPI003D1F282E